MRLGSCECGRGAERRAGRRVSREEVVGRRQDCWRRGAAVRWRKVL